MALGAAIKTAGQSAAKAIFGLDKPAVEIVVNGKKLINWTSLQLDRAKEHLTGLLRLDIFLDKIPDKPVETDILQGQSIETYIAGQCVFSGVLDKRRGLGRAGRGKTGKHGMEHYGATLSRSLGAGGYKIELQARGKCKYLIDSSHRHKTGTLQQTSDKKAIEVLTAKHKIVLDWQAEITRLRRVVLRDGALIAEEIFRLCNENCLFAFETADGKLRIANEPPAKTGGKIALGFNIMEFSAEQSESRANSEIIVKGHKSRRGIWGIDAVLDAEVRIKDKWVGDYCPLVVQHYGEADEEKLQKRAKWEADRRAAQSKQINVTLFHVLDEFGAPWDIGKLYPVSLPVEGINDNFECIALSYKIEASGEISTQLTLAPPPAPRPAKKRNALAGKNFAKQPPQSGRSYAPGGWPKGWGCANIANLPTSAEELDKKLGEGLFYPLNDLKKPL